MPGIGTLVNVGAVILGTAIGIVVKGGIPERFEKTINHALGIAIMFIGMSGCLAGLFSINGGKLETNNLMLLTVSLLIGGLVGEMIDLESKMEKLGEALKNKFAKNAKSSATFVEGFISAALLFTIGAMAIVGSLNDGLFHDPTVLFTKSILDGVTSILYGAAFGIGVGFSVIVFGVYQGLITLLAGLLAPVLSDALISNMACVGNAIIFAIGINFIFGKKIKVGNMFLAMFVPIIWTLVEGLIGKIF